MSKDNFVNDPNYGKGFRLCASGEVHLDGEACNREPQVQKRPVAHLGIDPADLMPMTHTTPGMARATDPETSREAAASVDTLRSNPDSSIQDVVELTGERYRSISPRFAPLRRKGLIFESGKKKTAQTGRTVQTWRAA